MIHAATRKIISASTILLALPVTVFALTEPNPMVVSDLVFTTTGIFRLLIGTLFVLAAVIFSWGIVKFLTAAGNGEAMTAAKGYIMWGLIGMAVLASIFGLIEFIQTFVGVETGSPTEFKPPEIN